MPDPKTSVLEQSIVTLLRPVIKIALKRGLAHGQFAELVKQAFVETTQKDFLVPEGKATISRIAVITGLTRKEASRLVKADSPPPEEGAIRRRVNRAARVVSSWVGDNKYRDGRGGPASLPFTDNEGPSFSSLVAEHSGDVTPRAVLDELIRVGAVDTLRDGRLRLIQRAYVPTADEEQKLHILGTDVADLINSIENNLDPESETPFYQRKVAYDNFPAEYLPQLKSLLHSSGQKLLEELNTDMSRHDRDVQKISNSSKRHRAMIGIYYYEESVDETD
jgi:hypothetical protein